MIFSIEGMAEEVARMLRRAGVRLGPHPKPAPGSPTGGPGALTANLVRWELQPAGGVVRVRVARHSSSADDYDFASDHPLAAATFIISRIAGLPEPLLTTDEAMFEVICQALRHARSATPVLLTGETGTGKELLAGLIHRASGRRGALITVNCPMLEGGDIQRQLLGDGSASASPSDHAPDEESGFLALARGGTLFLDHLDGISASTRRTIRIALRRHEASSADTAAGGRYIAAMAQPLTDRERSLLAIASSHPAVEIKLPPLRSRRTDIRMLAVLFMHALNPLLELGESALRTLEAYHFPGNIRELSNVLTQIAVDPAASDHRLLTADDIAATLRHSAMVQRVTPARGHASRWQMRVAKIFESCAGAYPQEIGRIPRRASAGRHK